MIGWSINAATPSIAHHIHIHVHIHKQFSNVLGDEDGNGGLGDLDGGGGDGQEAAGSGNGGVVDFVGGFDDAGGGDGGDDGGFGFGEGFGEGGDEEEAEGEDDDDSEEEEELELHVDEDGRLAFDGGEMDYAVRCVLRFAFCISIGPSQPSRGALVGQQRAARSCLCFRTHPPPNQTKRP